ncbi:hypothetical protein AMTRI_Chr04g181770 [Amborella trichopoda]
MECETKNEKVHFSVVNQLWFPCERQFWEQNATQVHNSSNQAFKTSTNSKYLSKPPIMYQTFLTFHAILPEPSHIHHPKPYPYIINDSLPQGFKSLTLTASRPNKIPNIEKLKGKT